MTDGVMPACHVSHRGVTFFVEVCHISFRGVTFLVWVSCFLLGVKFVFVGVSHFRVCTINFIHESIQGCHISHSGVTV